MKFEVSNNAGHATACRRGTERYRLLYSGEAFVELVGPDGRAWRLELMGISSQGLCFGLQGGQPVLERGSRVDGVVVQIGSARMDGMLLIAHATEEFASGTICGAAFHPTSEIDELKLREAIATLGW